MLTLAHKVAVRRHLGTPFAGTAQAGRLYGWRFTWYREDLEYRLNNLQPQEEQLLTGASIGSVRLTGRATVGETLTFAITDPTFGVIQAQYQVQVSDFALPANPVNPAESSALYSIALNMAQAINQAAGQAGYFGVGVMPADLYSPQYLAPYFAEVAVQGPLPGGTQFGIQASTNGTLNVFVEQQGTPSPVTAPVKGANGPQTLYGFIALCDFFALTYTRADLSLWLTKADVAEFRKDEVSARRDQYETAVFDLELVLGGRDYVDKFGGGRLRPGGGGGAVA